MPEKSIRKIIQELTYQYKNRNSIFTSLDLKTQSIVILKLSKRIQSQILSGLKRTEIADLLKYLDPDDSTDLVKLLPGRRQKEILSEIGEELQNKISLMLQFDPKTAAGIMSLNYIQVDTDHTLSEVAEFIKIHEKRTGRSPVVLVLENGTLAGYLPFEKLFFASPADKVRDFVKKIANVKQNAKYETVIDYLIENPHKKITVLDEDGKILGVIYSDDVLKIFHEQESSSLYDFAGVSNEETIFESAKRKIKFRYKWLIINLGTAFLAAFTVGLFGETISKFVLLAVYMPIVAGMGGNAATQTLAVLVRGIALNQIELKTALPTLRKELLAALGNGIITGALVALVVIIFNRDFKVALILAVAMVANLLVAAFFGTLVPLIMAKLKKDPATSATIFITTATDVLGFLAFLGLGALLLS